MGVVGRAAIAHGANRVLERMAFVIGLEESEEGRFAHATPCWLAHDLTGFSRLEMKHLFYTMPLPTWQVGAVPQAKTGDRAGDVDSSWHTRYSRGNPVIWSWKAPVLRPFGAVSPFRQPRRTQSLNRAILAVVVLCVFKHLRDGFAEGRPILWS
jgi:hypothetical protein